MKKQCKCILMSGLVVLIYSTSVNAENTLPYDKQATPPKNKDIIVITGNAFPQPLSSVLAPMDVITKDDIAHWQANSVTDVLNHIQGIDMSQAGGKGQTASLFVRGSEARHVLVLIDGVKMPVNSLGTTDFNQIPVALIEKIEFIRGPRSAVYGSEAIGGVLNIITQHKHDIRKLDVQLGSEDYQQYSGAWQQTFESTTVSLAGELEHTRGFNILPYSTNPEDSDRDGFDSRSIELGIKHQFSPSVAVFANTLHYVNNIQFDDAWNIGTKPERRLYSHRYTTGAQFRHQRFASQFTTTYQTDQDYNYDSKRGIYDKYTTFNHNKNTLVQWGNTYDIHQGMVSFGIDWADERLMIQGQDANNHYQRQSMGFYWTGYKTVDQWTFEGAARADHHQLFHWAKTWQTAVGYQLSDNYRIKLSYGTGYLAPTLQQLYGALGNYVILPNHDLKPEQSRQIELGFDGYYASVDWHVNLYRNDISNLIDSVSDNQQRYQNQNIGSSTIKGVEASVLFYTGHFGHQLSIDYLDPRNNVTGQILPRRAKYKIKYALEYNYDHINIALLYQWIDKRLDRDYDSLSWGYLPSYSLIGLSASYPINRHVVIHAKIDNILNKKYEVIKDYATAGRQFYVGASYQF